MSDLAVKYSPEKLKAFKAIIVENLGDVTEEISSLSKKQKDQKDHIANTNVDFNQNSKHFQQQAKNAQLIRRLETKARELQDALTRIEDESYGVCENTGKLIREERLKAMPTARFEILSK